MPQDFDPVRWYEAQQKKPAAPKQPAQRSAGGFDPVAWFEGRQGKTSPAEAPKPAPRTFAPGDPNDPLEQSVIDMSRRAFAAKPFIEQWKERGYDALARSGAYLSRAARQTAGAAIGGSEFLAGKPFRVVDIPAWRKFDE